jgi:predicted RecB family nuclease
MWSRYVFSASEVANFLACHHLLTLDRAQAAGQIEKPFFHDPGIELLRELGGRHERSYLSHLAQVQGLEIAEIPTNISWAEAAALTLNAIRRGVSAIYQATFQNGLWHGRSDFLIRVQKPSILGAWSYEPLETKLARSAKAGALIQLCFYADLLSQFQEVQPDWVHIVLGSGMNPEKYPLKQYIAYFRKIKRDFEAAYNQPPSPYPEPVEHCDVCSWFPVCDKRRHSDDHLSLVPGTKRNQRKVLFAQGVTTVASLAQLDLGPKPKIDGIGSTALVRIHKQARLQVEGRKQGHLVYELLEPTESDTGLAALPAPSLGDIFLDLEGDPYAFETGLEYLIGVLTLSEEAGEEPFYQPLWSLDRAAEKEAFQALIEKVMERWRRHPGMHVYHYAAYEPTQIKRMAGQHGVCIDEVDQLLKARIFVDLFRVVRQGVRASVESYSLKKIERLYDFTRVVGARDSVLALQTFAAALALGNPQDASGDILTSIESYNRDDCFSTLRLREWLEHRRRELEQKMGAVLPRPALKQEVEAEELTPQIQQVRAAMDRLTSSLPHDETEWSPEHRALWLLAQMLEYHRREDKSGWWEYFRQCDLSDDELMEDKNALGRLIYVGPIGQVKRSIVHRYSFPPQDHAIDRALEIHDPKTRANAGTVVTIDDFKGTIDIKRGIGSSVPHPTSLIPKNIVPSDAQRDSLLRIALWVAENGISAPGRFQAARDLLLRQPPRAALTNIDSLFDERQQMTEIAPQIMRSLCAQPSVLPVQGPPGSGKTYSGARMITELVRAGKRVGITAVSHKVISKLLQGACEAAQNAGLHLRAAQKANDDDGCADLMVRQLNNKEILNALKSNAVQVVAGTPWLWARQDMVDSIDVLFVDEAGQMSLADVLAISPAANSIVMLGDPQQLNQPQQGVHPPGVDVSALAHLLNGRATIDSEKGLFLKETWRLPPDICAFTSELFYDSRLAARPENRNQRLNANNFLDGTGLRFVPVKHSGNQSESVEEVEKVTELINGLLERGTTWTTKTAEKRVLKLEDVLVVAPYNAQVSALARRLPVGARVGTVDKFQGQEAPVVFYSMTTSTPDDAPRGMEFLYSVNRLNVAVSRAQCVSVVIASPALFQVDCKTPRQIQLANALCRYIEMAHSE